MALQDLTPQLRTRLSRVERAVGWFVLLAVTLLLFGFGYYLYTTAERKGWFKIKAPYFTFAESGTGLKVGDPVQLMGFDVGQITRIESQPPGDTYNVYVEFELISPYYGYIWTEGSRAKVTTVDLLGKRVLEVTKGDGGYPSYLFNPIREVTIEEARVLAQNPRWAFGEVVVDRSGTNYLAEPKREIANLDAIAALGSNTVVVMDLGEERKHITAVWRDKRGVYAPFNQTNLYWLAMDETPAVTARIEKLVSHVEAALPNILSLTNQLMLVLSNSADLTSNLNAVAAGVRPVVSQLAAATAHLDHPGALGEWLLPTNLNAGLEHTLTNASTTFATANATLASANTNLSDLAWNLNRSLDNLAAITSNLNSQVAVNSNMLSAISETIVHADQFVQGLKRHWLFRSAFKQKGTNAPPAAPVPPLRAPKDTGSSEP